MAEEKTYLSLERTADRLNRQRAEEDARLKAEAEEQKRFEAETAAALKTGEVIDRDIPANLPRLPKQVRESLNEKQFEETVMSAFKVFASRHPESVQYDMEPVLNFIYCNELMAADLSVWEYAFERLRSQGIVEVEQEKEKQERQRDPNTGQYLPFGVIAPPKREKYQPDFAKLRGWELDDQGYSTNKLVQYTRDQVERMDTKRFRRAFPN